MFTVVINFVIFQFVKKNNPFSCRFANQTSYVVLYGLVGCIFSMTYAYFNGTITTIEKRFKIPSKNTGIISVGNDISQMMVSAVLSYYAGRGHRPRWIGFGNFGKALFFKFFIDFLYTLFALHL